MTEARITPASSFPWAGFAGQIPAQSAEDVQRAKEWSARQARTPWPGLGLDSPMARRERHRRVQEWLQSRPVVARVRRVRPGETDECYAGWWELIPPDADGVPRPWQPGPCGGFLYRHHNVAVHWAHRMAEVEATP